MATKEARTDPKYVLRFKDKMTLEAVKEASDTVHISMNAFILQAIDEKLERGRYLDVLLRAAAKTLL
jgi:predicted HicB family RNase H-like nuclease